MTSTIKNKGASLEAIQDHYDLSNAFYKLWLDDNMVYSGAQYTSPDESLEQAQINKLEHHIRSSSAHTSQRVLDIGCGWGAILGRLQKEYQVSDLTGLTLSQAQADYCHSVSCPGADVRVQSWQEHQPSEPYDAIISIGAFEHFTKIEYSEEQKVDAYRDFFKKCRDVFLKPQGLLSLQTFAYGSVEARSNMVNQGATQFLAKEIFRETDPPHMSNIIEAMQGYFEIVDMHNDRLGYAKTLKEWIARLKSQKDAVIALVGEAEYDKYLKYLQYSYLGFQSAKLDLYRITLRAFVPKINS